MKLLTSLLGICFTAILVAFNPSGNSEFEGSFTYVIKTQKPDKVESSKTVKNVMNFYIKDGKTFIKNQREDTDYSFSMLIQEASDKFYILMDRNGRKIAMKQDLTSVEKMNSKHSDNTQANFTKTNRTKTIDGYHCTLYNVNLPDYKGDAWVTQELNLESAFQSVSSIMKQHPQSSGESSTLKATNLPEDGVVIKSTLEAKNGSEKIETHMKSISQGKVDQSKFDISQYRVMDLSGSGGSSFGN